MQEVKRLSGFMLGALLAFGVFVGCVQAEVVMNVLVVNPSETEIKEFSIRSALPPEVQSEDVLDADGLAVDYDSRAGSYFLTGSVTLKPKESVTKRVVLEDVWTISQQRFTDLRQETWSLLAKLRGTTYEEQGKILASSISRRLAAVEISQHQLFLSSEQHISRYRDNLKTLQSIETELTSLRQLMVMAAVEPMAKSVLGTSSDTEQDAGKLSILATWRMIFIIVGLLGFVSLSFFLVWQRQLKLQLEQQGAEQNRQDAAADELLVSGDGSSQETTALPPRPGASRIEPKSPLSS